MTGKKQSKQDGHACEKCKSNSVSRTLDGKHGLRNHCLRCGHVWKITPQPAANPKPED